jgi:hypothetical protein
MVEQPVSFGTRLVETCKEFVLDLNSALRGEHCHLRMDP